MRNLELVRILVEILLCAAIENRQKDLFHAFINLLKLLNSLF